MSYKTYFLFFVSIIMLCCSACSSDDNEPKVNGNNSNNSNSGSDLTTEFFVGTWEGPAPYRISGKVSMNNDGIWNFYSDGSYRCVGHNSYGYEYTEEGKWYFLSKTNTLVTDGDSQISWTIDTTDYEAGSWIGTETKTSLVCVYYRVEDGDANL